MSVGDGDASGGADVAGSSDLYGEAGGSSHRSSAASTRGLCEAGQLLIIVNIVFGHH